MVRLTHRDYDSLLRAVYELHQAAAQGLLRQEAPRVLSGLVPSDYMSVFHSAMDRATRTVRFRECWETDPRMTPELAAGLARNFPTHAFTVEWAERGMSEALRLSDFYSLRQLRGTALFDEFYRPAGAGRNLTFGTSDGAWTVGALRRASERDFTERDRALLTKILPHLRQAADGAEMARAARQQAVDHGLTHREREIAGWLSRGKTNDEIALILRIARRTVEKHVERVLAKLGVENRTSAALLLRDDR